MGPSLKPLSILSQDPSTMPLATPSISPSDFFSFIPSIALSMMYSVSPSDSTICDINEVLGQTIYVPAVGACWKVEIFFGGTLEGDFTDSLCSESDHMFSSTNGTFSLFDSLNISDNTALFIGASQGFSGTMIFKESLDIANPLLNILNWTPNSKEYELEVILPTCAAPSVVPSVVPSTVLSTVPTSSTCSIEIFLNRTLYLEVREACWQVQLLMVVLWKDISTTIPVQVVILSLLVFTVTLMD